MTIKYMQPKYEFEKFTVKDFIEKVKTENIKLPEFQRDIVWSKKQKKELAESLRKGIPFGIFLLAGKEPYILLDGLQRTHAIMDLYNAPQLFFDKNQVEDQIIENLSLLLGDFNVIITTKDKEEILGVIVDWVNAQENVDPTTTFKAVNLGRTIGKYFEIDDEKLPTFQVNSDDILSPIIQRVSKEVEELGQIKIPCILYTGDDSNLPDIFEKLNSTGTKLSKYQIFAANWFGITFTDISNREIKENIYEIYTKRQEDSNILIKGLSDEVTFINGPINLYEYLLGLGCLIEEKYPYLFKGVGDQIGFILASACLRGSIRDIIKLSKNIKPDHFLFDRFETALMDSLSIVNSELQPIISLRINKSQKIIDKVSRIVFHPTYQAASFVAKVFRDKYSLDDFAEKNTWALKEQWTRNIPYYYLLDQIEQNWRGSGDARLEDMLKNDRYEKELSASYWRNTLIRWFEENQLTKQHAKRQRVENVDLLFLNFIYRHVLSIDDGNNSHKIFHVEHLVPVNKLTGFVEKINEGPQSSGIPISAISNLCYLDQSLNISKKDKTIYQYHDDIGGLEDLATIESKFTFTTREEMDFVALLDEDNVDGWYELYQEFLMNRFKKLIEMFIDLNEIKD